MTPLPDFDALTWYVVQARDRAELKAVAELEELGYRAWLPTKEITINRHGRGPRREARRTIAILEGYVFLGAAGPVRWEEVRAAKHVVGVVHRWRRAPVYARPPTAEERAAGVEPPIEGYTDHWIDEPAVLRRGWHARLLRFVDAAELPPIDFEPGDTVRLMMDGFEGRTAEVVAISEDVTHVLMTMLGGLRILPVQSRFLENAAPKKTAIRDPDS